MARQKKDGLDYFPFDVDFFFADRRIKSLRARFGCDGIAIYIYLLTEIYRNGYYTLWDRDSVDNIIADLNVTEGLTSQVIEFLVSRSLLSSILVGSDTAITSRGIQKRYQEAVRSRKRAVYVNPKIWLLKNEETASFIKVTQKAPKSENYENKSGKKGDKSGGNDTKESKGKKSNISCVQDAHESAGETVENGDDKKTYADKQEALKHNFEIIYALYPKKTGRTNAFENYKQWVGRGKNIGGVKYHLTDRQIYFAVKEYIRQQEAAGQDDLKYWKNFDTLMGRQLLDYVRKEEAAG